MVSILLCCADAEEPTVGPIRDTLAGESLGSEIVAGLDDDPFAFGSRVDTVDGAGVFVLFESAALDRSKIRQLEGIFGARRGPGDELLVVRPGSDPHTIAGDIRRIAHKASDEFDDPTPDASITAMRDVVGVTEMTALRSERPATPHHPLISASDLDVGPAPAPKPRATANPLPKTAMVPRRPPPQVERVSIASPAPRKSRRTPIIIAVAMLVTLAAAAAVTLMLKGDAEEGSSSTAKPAPASASPEKPAS